MVRELIAFGVLSLLAVLVWTGVPRMMLKVVLDDPAIVYVRPTGECVLVEPSRAGTCDALPERYERVWVALEWTP